MKFLNKQLIDIFHDRVLKETVIQNMTINDIVNAIQMVDSKTNPPVNFQGINQGSAYSDVDCAKGYGPVARRIREQFEVLFNSRVINPSLRIDFDEEFQHFFDYAFPDHLDYLTANRVLGLSEKKMLLRCFVRWWGNNSSESIKKHLQFKIDTTFGRAYPRESTVVVHVDEQLKISLEHEGECRLIQIENKQPQIENQVHDLVFDYIKVITGHDLTDDYKELIQQYKDKIAELIKKINWTLSTSGATTLNNSRIVTLVNISGNIDPYITFHISNPSNYCQDEVYNLSFIIKQPIQKPELIVCPLSAPSHVPEQFVAFMTFVRHREFYSHLENLLAEQQKVGEDDDSETDSKS